MPEESAPKAASMDGPRINRGKVKEFLERGIVMMGTDESRQHLKDPEVQRPGLELIKMQRKGWDALGLDADAACQHLDKVDTIYPGDNELLRLRDEFVMTAQKTYLQSVHDRRTEGELERVKPMPRDAVIEFFDACNTTMDMPWLHKKMTQHVIDTKSMPNGIIIEAQKDLLEVLGFEREHGCRMLSNIGKDFPGDQEVHAKAGMWSKKAQHTCMMVLRNHQMSGGEMPEMPGMSMPEITPEMKELHHRAVAEVKEMDGAEIQALVEKFKKKFEIFTNLPAEARQSHMAKLTDADKLEFLKAQIVVTNMMRAQWAHQNGGQGQSHHGGYGGAASTGGAAATSGPPVAKPSQQTM